MSTRRTMERKGRRRDDAGRIDWLHTGFVLVPVTVGLLMFAAAQDAAARGQEGEEAEATPTATWEDCYACHDEAEAFVNGPHGEAMARHSEEVLLGSCVGCHGPGTEHMEDPNTENIIGQPGDEACLSCHSASEGHLGLAMPAHVRQGIQCLDCHYSGHVSLEAEAPPDTEWLLQASAYETCGECHPSQAAAAYRPFAHRNGAEPFECTECHSAHGLRRVGRLAFAGDGGACLDCHTEKAGPFVYPHPPGHVEGCESCHQVHGSTNPRMLDRRLVLNLCLECHANVPSFHDVTQARYRNCTSCHLAVHGSNRSPALFDE